MKPLLTLILMLTQLIVWGSPIHDSLVRRCYADMKFVADRWKTFPTSFDTVFCGGYRKKAEPRPICLHQGTFPIGSEFDFAAAKRGDVSGPYIDWNAVGVYRLVDKEMICCGDLFISLF